MVGAGADCDRDAVPPDARGGCRRSDLRSLARLVDGQSKPQDSALVVALAYPERVARRRTPGSPVYLMAGGTAVELPPGTGLIVGCLRAHCCHRDARTYEAAESSLNLSIVSTT